jgi:hypothetical protein
LFIVDAQFCIMNFVAWQIWTHCLIWPPSDGFTTRIDNFVDERMNAVQWSKREIRMLIGKLC